jgi:hypothetical protein
MKYGRDQLILFSMLGDNLGRSNLHLVVDPGGSHVQSATEEAGKGQSVVDAFLREQICSIPLFIDDLQCRTKHICPIQKPKKAIS